MCDPQTFDSRDSRYKRPYGAVPSGTRVELALRPPRAGGFSAATLIAYFEHRDEERRELPMPWRGLEGDRDVFDIALETGDYVGLVWYSFRLEGLDGRREELGPFQLTVYDGAEEVPAWFGEGVTYQIFPDRFRRTRVPDPTGMVGGRSVHTGWEEEPVYRPDSIWPACGRSWATCGAWGWIPSTSAPSSRPRRTTATAPGTMRRSTPCWAPRPTSAPCAPRPTPWACGWCWTACSTTRALSAAISTATAPMRA